MNDPQSVNGWRHRAKCKPKTCVVAMHQIDVWDEALQTFYEIPRAACIRCGWTFDFEITAHKEVL